MQSIDAVLSCCCDHRQSLTLALLHSQSSNRWCVISLESSLSPCRISMQNMSEDNEADTTSCCASCNIAEVDDIKLKDCGGCDLVRYCSDECQENHRSEHEEACKKRAAELRDELLFRQPESSHLGDCPLCCVPLPIDKLKTTMHGCCSKVICNGCTHAIKMRDREMRLRPSCPFCREPVKNDAGHDKQRMKRVEANDPGALLQEGVIQGSKGHYFKAFEYCKKAADLGVAEAHFHLAYMYHEGEGVEKNKGKAIYHHEEAAIGGHPDSRHWLGLHEFVYGNKERAVKHWIIAATQGQDESMKELMTAFKHGQLSKEDLAATLRAHKAAVDATKSPQRREAEEIEKFYRNGIANELTQICQLLSK